MKYSSAQIFKLYDDYRAKMEDSFKRGEKSLDFIECSNQFETSTDTQEQLVFNNSQKIVKTAKANGKNIELSLSYSSDSQPEQEVLAYEMLTNDIMFNKSSTHQISTALDKVYDYGQAVLWIKPVRESERTLNKTLKVECLRNPRDAFFDLDAAHPSFIDGKYCGRLYHQKSKAMQRHYKKLKGYDLPSEVEVIEFWCKIKKKTDYIALSTGEYIRKELFNSSTMMEKSLPPKKGTYTQVLHCRVIRGYDMILDQETLDTDMLPMVMDYGGIVSLPKKYESYPLGHVLQDPQVLLNYTGSVIADMCKDIKGDKYFISPSHIQSDAARKGMEEVNERSGAIVVTGDPTKINRQVSSQVPPSLSNIFNELPNLMNGLAGSYLDGNRSEVKAVSGVALDKLFDRMDLVQNNVICAHIHTVNLVGKILQSYIPIYFHEERSFTIKDSTGNLQTFMINQRHENPNGQITIKNDISTIRDCHFCEIKASVSKELSKQNTRQELLQLYQIYPNAVMSTIDLYANSLDVQNAEIIAKRLGASIPQYLVDYGNGKITQEKFEQASQQDQMQKEKMMQQMQSSNPQAQYLMAKTQGEQARAQTASYEAQTQRLRLEGEEQNNQMKNANDAVKIHTDSKIAQYQQELEAMKAVLAHQNKLLELYHSVGAHETHTAN